MRQGTRYAIVSGPNGERFSLWNLAHDLSFNPEILDLSERVDAKGDIELPPGAANEAKYKGMSAEEIYDKLLKQALDNRDKNNGQGGMGVLTQFPGDGHTIGDDMRPDLSSTKTGQDAAAGDKSAQNQLENDWKVSVVAAAQVHAKEKERGTLPLGIQKIVDELLDPRVDWKDILSRWIGENGKRQDYTYRRPARRSESIGEYLPSLQRFGVADVVVLWDTSGSMNGREKEILGDVQGICEDLGISVRVMCCDTEVHTDVDDIEDAIDLIGQIKGGGGSDFTPAFDKLDQESYDGVMVCFTDGYIGVPAQKPVHLKAVLWCIEGGDVDPSGGRWGEVLKINDEEMGR
jgi:predicted metal-dependent peptidase